MTKIRLKTVAHGVLEVVLTVSLHCELDSGGWHMSNRFTGLLEEL